MVRTMKMVAAPRAVLYSGEFGTGKTERLVRRVVELLGGGVTPKDILVLCASPTAAGEFSRRLQQTAGALAEAAEGVQVTIPRKYFLAALATPEAQEAIGRDARLLTPFEHDFFLEDLKTSGIAPKRLHEMMKFFYKQYAELADFEENWLMTVEEQELYDLMQNCLGFTRSLLPEEVSGMVIRAMQAGAMDVKVPYVLVDDFQLLSRGSQVACTMLVSTELTVAANSARCCEVFESYPNKEGVEEFTASQLALQEVCLTKNYSCVAGYRMASGLLAAAAGKTPTADDIASAGNKAEDDALTAGMDTQAATQARKAAEARAAAFVPGVVDLPDNVGAGVAEVTRLWVQEPQDEMVAVADFVQARLAAGVDPAELVIVTPQRSWQRNIVKVLNKAGVATSTPAYPYALSGDIRVFEGCPATQVFTALELLANPADCVAWRSWLGFGDYLANSNGMRVLRDFGANRGQALDAAVSFLDTLKSSGASVDAEKSLEQMSAALERCKVLFDACRGLTGKALLEAVAAAVLGQSAPVPQEVLQFVALNADGPATVKDTDTAADMITRAFDRIWFSAANSAAVRVLPVEAFAGIAPQVLLVVGFVNGFFPKGDLFDLTKLTPEKREQRRVASFERAAFVLGAAREQLVVSGFDHLDLELAKRTHLVIDRIGLVDEVGKAFVQPSVFLQY